MRHTALNKPEQCVFYRQLLRARSLVADSVAITIAIPERIPAIVGADGATALSVTVSAGFTRCAKARAAVMTGER